MIIDALMSGGENVYRFHVVSEFDESKRSCRRRLAGHNERRRKCSHDSLARGSSHGVYIFLYLYSVSFCAFSLEVLSLLILEHYFDTELKV